MRALVPTDPAQLKRNNFNAIRLAMALAVVWSHSFALGIGTEDSEPISQLLGNVYNAGNLAVLTFFAVSGFLITDSYIRSENWKIYLRNRVARIYPGYLVAVAVCSFIVVPLFSTGFYWNSAHVLPMLSNVFLKGYIPTSDAFGGGAVNGSLWSISYEFWCYIGILGLGITGLLKRRMIFPVIAFVVIVVRIWLDLTGRRPAGVLQPLIGMAYFWFNVLPPFLLGAAFLLYRDSIPRSRWLLAALILCTIAASHLPIDDLHRTVITRTLMPLTLAYTTLYVAFSSIRLPNVTLYGDFSYGTYLYAFPIQQMLRVEMDTRASLPMYAILSAILSVLAGVASWWLVERWFLALAKRSRRTAPLTTEEALVAP